MEQKPPRRELSHSPDFIKVGVIVLLVALIFILIAKIVIGFKLGIFGL